MLSSISGDLQICTPILGPKSKVSLYFITRFRCRIVSLQIAVSQGLNNRHFTISNFTAYILPHTRKAFEVIVSELDLRLFCGFVVFQIVQFKC